MRFCSIVTSFSALFLSCMSLCAEEEPQGQPQKVERKELEPFTGQILKNRVRMRLQPSLDAYVFSELKRGDVILVTHQVDDFYACVPPKGLKGYIFRTYVLDNAVEGSNVNIRLEPDTASPVIAQLNTGDAVKGVIASQNNKWLEIELPESVKFYVAKELVGKAGPASLYGERINRLHVVKKELSDLQEQIDAEMQKPFPEIQLSPFASRLTRIAVENSDMVEEVSEAKALTAKMQEAYLAKGAEYRQSALAAAKVQAPVEYNVEIVESVSDGNQVQVVAEEYSFEARPDLAIFWKNQEERLMQEVMDSGESASAEQFYANQLKRALQLTGIIKPYNSYGKNRPGDFILIDQKSQLPIAYLYSTTIDLQNYVAKPVSMQLAERPNNHFAIPAYFVLSIEE